MSLFRLAFLCSDEPSAECMYKAFTRNLVGHVPMFHRRLLSRLVRLDLLLLQAANKSRVRCVDAYVCGMQCMSVGKGEDVCARACKSTMPR